MSGQRKPESLDKVTGIRRSAFECATIIRLCADNDLISVNLHDTLFLNLEEIAKMLTGLIKSNNLK